MTDPVARTDTEKFFLPWRTILPADKLLLGDRFRGQIALRGGAEIEEPDPNIQGLRTQRLGCWLLLKETSLPPLVRAVEFREGTVVKQGTEGEQSREHSSISFLYLMDVLRYQRRPLDKENKRVMNTFILNGMDSADEEGIPFYFSIGGEDMRRARHVMGPVDVGAFVENLISVESLDEDRDIKRVWPPS